MTTSAPAYAAEGRPRTPLGTPAASAAPAAASLLARLGDLRDRAAALVESRSAGDPTAGDPLRGLYVSEEMLRHLLRPADPGPAYRTGPGTGDDRLAGLAAAFGLTDLDATVLLVAVAPDLDRAFGPLYGYLNDDVSRRRATVGLALDLCGVPAHVGEARARFHPSAPLAALGLLAVQDPEEPFLSRRLHVPDRLVAHLLGDDTPDPVLAGCVRPLPYGAVPAGAGPYGLPDAAASHGVPDAAGPDGAVNGAGPYSDVPGSAAPGGVPDAAGASGTGLSGTGPSGAAPGGVPDAAGASGAALSGAGASGAGPSGTGPSGTGQNSAGGGSDAALFVRRLAALLAEGPALVHVRERREGDALAGVMAALGAARLPALRFSGGADVVPQLLREARLTGSAVVVCGLPDEPAPLLRALTPAVDVPVLITSPRPYDPQWSDRDPLALEAPPHRAGAVEDWSRALGAGPEGVGFDLAATVAPYHLAGDAVARAAGAARALASFDGGPLTAAHVRLAARRQSASGLERHARRIRPEVGWEDLVLPERPLAELHEFALRARHRDRVLGDWRLSAGGGRGRGVLGLFAGGSGTGKTLSAEVVAAELGLDLYVVQLSSVVDKYVGETEKNLERIFTEADRTDAVLLFDEADAVFGKRSDVKDSHDRYANLESAYLLQRLEAFDGVAVLTTNLRANIDEAFTRRLDMVVDFPFPDAAQRVALWRHGLAHVPVADGLEPAALAEQFELAGGSIRSAMVTAAYLAAGRGEPVGAADLLEGARREYRKAGRLVPGEGAW